MELGVNEFFAPFTVARQVTTETFPLWGIIRMILADVHFDPERADREWWNPTVSRD